MDKNRITLQEVANDGQSIYLYYDDMIGLYVAYGLSAYYTTMVVDAFTSYSDEMQMPVVLLKREHILFLRQSLTKVEHTPGKYYHFRIKAQIGEAGYQRWLCKVLGTKK